MLRTGIDAVERRSEHSPNPKHMIRTTMRPSACCCCCTCCLLKSLLWHFSLVVCSGRSTPWQKGCWSCPIIFLFCRSLNPSRRHTQNGMIFLWLTYTYISNLLWFLRATQGDSGQFRATQLNSAWLSLTQFNSAGLSWTQLDSARLS